MTTICVHASSERLTLYFYGELPAGERRAVEQHLTACGACSATLADFELMRAALLDRASPTRSQDEWDGFMRRLTAQLEAPETVPRSGLGLRSKGPVYALAAMLVLATGLGLVWQRRVLGPAQAHVGDAGTTDATLAAAAERHFERAKLVVLGIAMKDPDRTNAADWEYERHLAASLLPETRLFRMSATDLGDARLASLLGDLENVLLQAAMTTDAEGPELERLQHAIRRRDLLMRMDLREL